MVHPPMLQQKVVLPGKEGISRWWPAIPHPVNNLCPHSVLILRPLDQSFPNKLHHPLLLPLNPLPLNNLAMGHKQMRPVLPHKNHRNNLNKNVVPAELGQLDLLGLQAMMEIMEKMVNLEPRVKRDKMPNNHLQIHTNQPSLASIALVYNLIESIFEL